MGLFWILEETFLGWRKFGTFRAITTWQIHIPTFRLSTTHINIRLPFEVLSSKVVHCATYTVFCVCRVWLGNGGYLRGIIMSWWSELPCACRSKVSASKQEIVTVPLPSLSAVGSLRSLYLAGGMVTNTYQTLLCWDLVSPPWDACVTIALHTDHATFHYYCTLIC